MANLTIRWQKSGLKQGNLDFQCRIIPHTKTWQSRISIPDPHLPNTCNLFLTWRQSAGLDPAETTKWQISPHSNKTCSELLRDYAFPRAVNASLCYIPMAPPKLRPLQPSPLPTTSSSSPVNQPLPGPVRKAGYVPACEPCRKRKKKVRDTDCLPCLFQKAKGYDRSSF